MPSARIAPYRLLRLSPLCAALLLVGPSLQAQTPRAHSASSAGKQAPTGAKAKAAAVEPTGSTVVIDTSMGRLTCRLYSAQAPELTANFVALADGSVDWKDPSTGELQHAKSFYDGSAIFGSTTAVSGGDRLGQGKGTAGDPLPDFKPNGLTFDRPGRLAMTVLNGKTSRSMFFITDHANDELAKRGVVFGQCDEASAAKVTEISHLLLSTDNHPTKLILINKLTVAPAGQPLPPVAPDLPSETLAPQTPPLIPSPEPTGATALIDTSMGQLSCRLFEKEAPVATKTFIGLAEGTRDWTMPGTHTVMHGKPFYNGLLFNRVLPDFMIQNQNYPGGSSGGGDIGIKYSIEIVPGLNFDRPGRLAMANSGPDTNDSSFYITEQPRSALNEKYTIFGQCDDASVKLVQAIARVPRNEHNRPVTPVVIRKVTIGR